MGNPPQALPTATTQDRFLSAVPTALAVVSQKRVRRVNAAFAQLLEQDARTLQEREVDVFLPALQWAEDSDQAVTLVTAQGQRRAVAARLTRLSEEEWLLALSAPPGPPEAEDLMLRLAQLGASLPSARSEAEVLRWLYAGLSHMKVPFVFGQPVEPGLFRMDHAWVPVEYFAGQAPEAEMTTRAMLPRIPPTLGRAWAEGAAQTMGPFEDVFGSSSLGNHLGAPSLQVGPGFCFIAVRIDVGNVPRWVLGVGAEWIRPESLPALRLFGAQIGTALEAVSAFQTLAQRNTVLSVVNRVATRAATMHDADAFLRSGAEDVLQLFDYQRMGLYLWSEEDDSLELHFTLPERDSAPPLHARLPVHGSFLGSVVLEGVARSILYDEAQGLLRASMETNGLRAAACVPLRLHGRNVGAMVISSTELRRLSDAELATLDTLGGYFAAAVESHRLFDELNERVNELTLLLEVAIRYSSDPQEAQIAQTLSRVRRVLDAPGGAAYVADGMELRCIAFDGMESPPKIPFGPAHGQMRIPPGGVWTPLMREGRLLGGMYLHGGDSGLSSRQLELIHTVGAQLAVAVERSLLFHETERRAADLSIINEMSRSLVGTFEQEALVRVGVQALSRIVDVPSVVVLLADEKRERLQTAGFLRGPESAWTMDSWLPTSPPESSLGARVFHSREPLWIEDGRIDPRVNQEARRAVNGIAYLVLPLVARDEPIGVAVLVDTRRTRIFTDSEVARASAITNQLAAAVHSARLFEDLRKSYAELGRAHEQLVQSERLAALGEMSAAVAHEVRNPLGAIFNALASIRRIVKGQEGASTLIDIALEEAERLNRIVTDLLGFARPNAPWLKATPLEPLLEDAVATAVHEASAPIQVEWSFPPGVPSPVVDEGMMRQALLNLTLNAVQAMPQGGRLRVSLQSEPGAVRIEIRDSGQGISEEVRPRIFEAFYTTKATGTGLGLALVKRIVDMHLGKVLVESAPGEGATFAVVLPLRD